MSFLSKNQLLAVRRQSLKIGLLAYLLIYFKETVSAHDFQSSRVQDFSFQVEDANSLKKQTAKGLHMVLFYRTSCPYCIDFWPVYETLAKEYQGKSVTFGAVRMTNDYSARMSDKAYIRTHYYNHSEKTTLNINTFPCLVIVKDGEVVRVLQGSAEARSIDQLRQHIDYYLTGSAFSVVGVA